MTTEEEDSATLPGPRLQHRQLELPNERPGPCRVGAGPLGNAVIAKRPVKVLSHPDPRHALMRRLDYRSPCCREWARKLANCSSVLRDWRLRVRGGRANGRRAAVSLADTGRRHMLEQEVLTLGHLGFLAVGLLAQHLRKGFEYGKQRCTAIPLRRPAATHACLLGDVSTVSMPSSSAIRLPSRTLTIHFPTLILGLHPRQ